MMHVIHLVIKCLQVCCIIFDVEHRSSSPLPPPCLTSGLCWICGAYIRCTWQKLGDPANCLGDLRERRAANKVYKKSLLEMECLLDGIHICISLPQYFHHVMEIICLQIIKPLIEMCNTIQDSSYEHFGHQG